MYCHTLSVHSCKTLPLLIFSFAFLYSVQCTFQIPSRTDMNGLPFACILGFLGVSIYRVRCAAQRRSSFGKSLALRCASLLKMFRGFSIAKTDSAQNSMVIIRKNSIEEKKKEEEEEIAVCAVTLIDYRRW